MESHSSSLSPRRVEKPLRHTLLQAPFDRIIFDLTRYLNKESNGNILRDVLDFIQLGEHIMPINYRIIAYDDIEYPKAPPPAPAPAPAAAVVGSTTTTTTTATKHWFPQMFRKHRMFQCAGYVPVNEEDPEDDGEMEYRVQAFPTGTATWTVDPLDDSGPGARCYRDGFVEFKVKRVMVRVDSFVSVQSAGSQIRGRVCIPCPQAEGGGVESFNIEVSRTSHEMMIMEAKTPNNAIALKFSLTLDDSRGILEVWSRGIDYTIAGYTYLRELIFALWLCFCEENQVYFERW